MDSHIHGFTPSCVTHHSICPEDLAQATQHVAERLGEAVAGDAAAAGLGAVGGRTAPLVILLLLLVDYIGLLRWETFDGFEEYDVELWVGG